MVPLGMASLLLKSKPHWNQHCSISISLFTRYFHFVCFCNQTLSAFFKYLQFEPTNTTWPRSGCIHCPCIKLVYFLFFRKHLLEFVAAWEVVKAHFCKLSWGRLVISDYFVQCNPNFSNIPTRSKSCFPWVCSTQSSTVILPLMSRTPVTRKQNSSLHGIQTHVTTFAILMQTPHHRATKLALYLLI